MTTSLLSPLTTVAVHHFEVARSPVVVKNSRPTVRAGGSTGRPGQGLGAAAGAMAEPGRAAASPAGAAGWTFTGGPVGAGAGMAPRAGALARAAALTAWVSSSGVASRIRCGVQ